MCYNDTQLSRSMRISRYKRWTSPFTHMKQRLFAHMKKKNTSACVHCVWSSIRSCGGVRTRGLASDVTNTHPHGKPRINLVSFRFALLPSMSSYRVLAGVRVCVTLSFNTVLNTGTQHFLYAHEHNEVKFTHILQYYWNTTMFRRCH